MALFQFRKGRDEQSAPSKPAQTVEALRRRAMHRLIGAAVLVVAGVIGFPMIFDNQPRPIAVDLPIVIPDKAKSAALVIPPAAAARPSASAAAVAAAPVAPAPAPAPVAAPAPAVVATPAPAPAPVVVAPPAKPAAASNAAATVAPAAKPAPSGADASKAQALLDGKDTGAPATGAEEGSRFVVQVGAFADAAKVREVRQKVEGAGLKTYTQVVETKEGSRTRVRVGPFGDKAEANRVADKIKKLDLPVAILSL